MKCAPFETVATADSSVSLCFEIKTPDFSELEKLNLLSIETVTPLLVYYGCLFLWNEEQEEL